MRVALLAEGGAVGVDWDAIVGAMPAGVQFLSPPRAFLSPRPLLQFPPSLRGRARGGGKPDGAEEVEPAPAPPGSGERPPTLALPLGGGRGQEQRGRQEGAVGFSSFARRLLADPPDILHAHGRRLLPLAAAIHRAGRLGGHRPKLVLSLDEAPRGRDAWLLRRADARLLATGADITAATGSATAWRAPAAWAPRPGSPPTIVAAGGYAVAGPMRLAVWAFELLRRVHPAARLSLVGRGPARPAVEAFARRLAFDDDRIEFCDEAPPRAAVFWQMDAAASSALTAAQRAGVPALGGAGPRAAELLGAGAGFVAPGDPVRLARETLRLLESGARPAPRPEFAPGEVATRLAAVYHQLGCDSEPRRD